MASLGKIEPDTTLYMESGSGGKNILFFRADLLREHQCAVIQAFFVIKKMVYIGAV